MENIAVFLDYNLDIEEKSVWKIAQVTPDAAEYPFIINESGVFYARDNFYTKRYAKNDFQIIYTVSGAAEMEYEEEKWRLSEGGIAIIDCNKYHSYRTAEDAGHWTYYWIHTGGGYCGRYYEAIYKKGFQPYAIGMDNEVLSCFKEVLEQIDYTTDTAYIRLCNAVGQIFTRLMLFVNSSPPSTREVTIQKAQEYIKNHYNEQFSIDRLAAHLNLSKYYLIKLFSTYIGMTPYHYLILYRINEAKKLLRATDHKLSVIARAVGFEDTSNFSRTFIKFVGVTPARYRSAE